MNSPLLERKLLLHDQSIAARPDTGLNFMIERCKEEIGKLATKCSHCGEWLPSPIEKSDVGNTREERNKEDQIDLIETNIKTEPPPINGNIKCKEIYIGKSVLSKPSKYGWGWALWLGLALAGISNISFSDNMLYFIAGVILLVSLIPYFALRRRFLMKWSFPGSKPLGPGLAAGIVIYLLSIGLFAIMSSADGMLLDKKMQSVDAKYKARVAALKREEMKYEAKFINRPRHAGHMRQNVKAIDAILAHNRNKQQLFHEMLDDYRQALKGKRSKTDQKPFEQSIDQILSDYDASYEKWHESWTSLRTHYLTGKTKYYQRYTDARQDATQSATDVRKGIREAFGTPTIFSFAE